MKTKKSKYLVKTESDLVVDNENSKYWRHTDLGVEVEARSESEAREIFLDELWGETDEGVWIQDGFEAGEKGFSDWGDHLIVSVRELI